MNPALVVLAVFAAIAPDGKEKVALLCGQRIELNAAYQCPDIARIPRRHGPVENL